MAKEGSDTFGECPVTYLACVWTAAEGLMNGMGGEGGPPTVFDEAI